MGVAIRETIAGRYLLGDRLGGGGMGEVYEATDVRLDRPVALKILRDGLLTNPGMVERAEAEARVAAKIHHPNVVAVLDAGRIDGTPFVVMERLSGLSLRDRLGDAPLEDEEIRRVGSHVLRGLSAAHDLGVVHRDVKPTNLLLGPGGAWKVADFGIATLLAGETTLTASGEIIGSAAYLAPERLGGLPATPASDLFSVGVLLYEAATGHRPVERDEPLATALAIRDGEAEPLSTYRPKLDPRLRAAIERALEPDPRDRWATADAFAEALGPPLGTRATEVLRIPEPGGSLAEAGTEATDEEAPPTERILAPSTTAVLPAEEAGPTEKPAATLRRRAAPARALRIMLGAALVMVIVLALAMFALAPADAPPEPSTARPGPAKQSVGTSVPDELESSLETLAEAIAP